MKLDLRGTTVKITKNPCSQCPWVEGGIQLRPGRLKQLHAETTKKDRPFLCHKFIYNDNRGIICSGWAKHHSCSILQLAERLNHLEEVDVS